MSDFFGTILGNLFAPPRPMSTGAVTVTEYCGVKVVADPRLRKGEMGLSYDGGETLRHRFTLNTFDPPSLIPNHVETRPTCQTKVGYDRVG